MPDQEVPRRADRARCCVSCWSLAGRSRMSRVTSVCRRKRCASVCARWRLTRALARPDLPSSEEREEIKALRKEVFELRRANEILKAASVFFATELDADRPR